MATAIGLIFIVLIFRSVGGESIATLAPPPAVMAEVLTKFGFRELAAVTAAANISVGGGSAAVTVFAAADSALLSCPACSLPLLLREHSVPGFYPFHYLRTFAFGTKISTLAPNRCLTVTSSAAFISAVRKVFINGAEISKPDLFNNGRVIIHGIQGFVSHLSPFSCQIERQTTLNFIPKPPYAAEISQINSISRMLRESMMELQGIGYSIVSLAMRVKYSELSQLTNVTIFAVDDDSIFSGEAKHSYISDLGFHIVPNRRLIGSDLIALPPETVLPTMEPGRSLVVTTAGGGGRIAPLRINFVKIEKLDVVVNGRIVIHGLSTPFSSVDQDRTVESDF